MLLILLCNLQGFRQQFNECGATEKESVVADKIEFNPDDYIGIRSAEFRHGEDDKQPDKYHHKPTSTPWRAVRADLQDDDNGVTEPCNN